MPLYDLILEGLAPARKSELLREALIRHNQGYGKIEMILAGLAISALRNDLAELTRRCEWLERRPPL